MRSRQTEKESYPLKGQRKNGRHGWIVPFYTLDTVRTSRGLREDKPLRRREDLLCPAAATHLKNPWNGNETLGGGCSPNMLSSDSAPEEDSSPWLQAIFYIVWNCVMKIPSHHASSPDWLLTRGFSCYICQTDLWSWSCTVHIRCTWAATACPRNKPTDHSHKFTFLIVLKKK